MATKLASLIWHFHAGLGQHFVLAVYGQSCLYSAVGGCTFRRLVGCRIAPCFKIEICVALPLVGLDVLGENFQK